MTTSNVKPKTSGELSEIYLNHQRSIDTLNSFINLIPSNDDYHGVLSLIAEQLNRTFLDVIPVFSSAQNPVDKD